MYKMLASDFIVALLAAVLDCFEAIQQIGFS